MDKEKLEWLEQQTKNIEQKIQELEDRLTALENKPA